MEYPAPSPASPLQFTVTTFTLLATFTEWVELLKLVGLLDAV
jgi:hypothetical protein